MSADATNRTLTQSMSSLRVTRDDINILLLGESGTGKSTFINATYFYLLYESMDDMAVENFHPLIPFSFAYDDDSSNDVEITGGDRQSAEHQGINGSSATQTCRSYTFKVRTQVFRIIDTPGIGDTQGFEKDMRNFQQISNYISKFTHLNAVCFLMKPNESKLGVQFTYCINELLRHLSKTTRDHVCFIFTNARQTFFQPGNISPIISKLLKKNETESGLHLEFSKRNTFFFDNEGFRYLALRANGYELAEDLIDSYKKSWHKTKEECLRFIRHCTSQTGTDIRSTVDLMDAERIIRKIPRPIANILQMIQENISLSEKFKKQVNDGVLDDKNGIEQREAHISRLPYPRTVCSSSECCRLIEDDKEKRIEFTKICHRECYLHGVAQEVIADEKLDACESFDPVDRVCRICHCSWKKHLHITYEYKTVIKRLKSLGDIDKFIHHLRAELSTIQEVSEKLNAFLLANSLLPINKSITDYLEYFIQVEESNRNRNATVTEKLKQMKKDMLRMNGETEERLKHMRQNSDTVIVPEASEIPALIDQLYKLPINGAMIEQQVKDIGNFEFITHVNESVITLPAHCMNNPLVKAIQALPE